MARRDTEGKRIPAPPVVRDRVVVERVWDGGSPDGEQRPGTGAKKRNRGGPAVDVSDVRFIGLAGDTESKLRRRLIDAAVAFDRERFGESQKLLQSIEKLAPGVPEVLELLGLSYYRQGKWREAIRELERFEAATSSFEQYPVLADCYRARREYSKVEELWRALGEASPTAELVEEGRIVYAGALADQGKLREAIRALEAAPKAPRKPKLHHLRRWYALADLYERGGDLKRAKRLFSEIDGLEPGFGDVRLRMSQLR